MGLKPYLLLACLCVSSGVLAKNESVKISVGQEGNYRVVNVTGLANELTINKVVANSTSKCNSRLKIRLLSEVRQKPPVAV